jgi:release factor glutamine methyltransferase
VLPFARQTAAQVGLCRILDLGTGSGAIALALLQEVPQARAEGFDISAEALATAASNAAANGLADRFSTRLSDWFGAAEGRYHLIVSNPPYIRTDELEGLEPEVRSYDPLLALDGGRDGLDAYRAIARDAGQHLAPEGLLAVEIGRGQEVAVTELLRCRGLQPQGIYPDLAGIVRVLSFRANHAQNQ